MLYHRHRTPAKPDVQRIRFPISQPPTSIDYHSTRSGQHLRAQPAPSSHAKPSSSVIQQCQQRPAISDSLKRSQKHRRLRRQTILDATSPSSNRHTASNLKFFVSSTILVDFEVCDVQSNGGCKWGRAGQSLSGFSRI